MKQGSAIEPREDQPAHLLDARAIRRALSLGLGEQCAERDTQGRRAGELAYAIVQDSGRDRRNGAGLVHRFANLVDVALFAGARRIAAEFLDVGVLVVGHPHAAGSDGHVAKILDAATEIHLERLHRDAVGAIAQPSVQLILKR